MDRLRPWSSYCAVITAHLQHHSPAKKQPGYRTKVLPEQERVSKGKVVSWQWQVKNLLRLAPFHLHMHAHSGVRAREKIFVLKLDFAAEKEREKKSCQHTYWSIHCRGLQEGEIHTRSERNWKMMAQTKQKREGGKNDNSHVFKCMFPASSATKRRNFWLRIAHSIYFP